jgi:hypothetical protein
MGQDQPVAVVRADRRGFVAGAVGQAEQVAPELGLAAHVDGVQHGVQQLRHDGREVGRIGRHQSTLRRVRIGR